jgi:hypothetical protein
MTEDEEIPSGRIVNFVTAPSFAVMRANESDASRIS